MQYEELSSLNNIKTTQLNTIGKQFEQILPKNDIPKKHTK
jgi:hypothetical protein